MDETEYPPLIPKLVCPLTKTGKVSIAIMDMVKINFCIAKIRD
jgi:hypothetical protein